MKYVANPVEVDAFKIVSVIGSATVPGEYHVRLEDGATVRATLEMTARMVPREGDYWVVQSDGYVYLNPKDVFERKYRKKE